MKVWLVLPFVVACATDPSLGEVFQAGTSSQGTSSQGTSSQGTSSQGTSSQGTTSGGITASDAWVVGTDLHYWQPQGNGWLEISGRSRCAWNSARTIKGACVNFDLATQSSPLVGSTWPTIFMRETPSGVTKYDHLKVQVAHVFNDTSVAMFDLRGAGAPGTLVDCDNPGNCRRNTDLFLYSVNVIALDGTASPLCPPGQSAMALAGYWDKAAMHHADASKFSFVCTNGTIAKCVRWGYRPWTSALKQGQPSITPKTALAPYHQSCVHAAMADYCGDGSSFTKDGTVVDVYDYTFPSNPGFIQQRRSVMTPFEDDQSMVWEAGFDNLGAYILDHARYREQEKALNDRCGKEWSHTNDVVRYDRIGPSLGPSVQIDSTPSCAHSHLMKGRALHPGCSKCVDSVEHVLPRCTDPLAPEGWDDACVLATQQYPTHESCNTENFPPHSECQTGQGLNIYASGCTLKLSLSGNASCFNTASSTAWTSACIAAANRYCTGGQEHDGAQRVGFCNQPISDIIIKTQL